MNHEYSSRLAEVVACRDIVEDYTNRIEKACVEYYESGKTEFPSLSRAEDEDVHQQCELVLLRLVSIMPDVMNRWQNIKYPIGQYDQMIERMRDVMVRRRNLLRAIEKKLRTMLDLDNLSELSKIEAAKPQKQEIIMGDKYVTGQAGAVGPNSHAHDMTFSQIWNQVEGTIDLPRLANELGLLRQEMKKEAIEPEQDVAVGAIAAAEQAAKSGNGPKALEFLKSAGKWALDVAEKIGVGVATAAIKSTLGI